jgi:hypothetical protein
LGGFLGDNPDKLFAEDRNVGAANFGARKLLNFLNREFDDTIGQSEQGVVFAHTDADAGFHAGTALAHDDAAGPNELVAKTFYAEAL